MEEADFVQLYDQYHNMVYRLALVSMRSMQDAEDVVQSVFLKLLEGKRPPEPGHERGWLATVTVNVCRDLLRWRMRRKTEPLDEQIPFCDPAESALFDAVTKLPQRYRVAVHLHYFEGYTCDEIGDMLDITPSAVSMRLHRARKLLRSELKEAVNETTLLENL